MSLFASLGQGDIWALSGISFTSAINDILDKEYFTLEELLEEDELIQEVKSKNEQLLEFLCLETTIDALVQFIITPPLESDTPMRQYKYPYMSCEVICCEIPEILSSLVEDYDGKYLKRLFSLLAGTEPLDSYLSGYFEKILEMLFRRMTVPLMKFINESGSALLVRFLDHMNNYSIMQIVQRLMLPHIPFCNQADSSDILPFDDVKEHYQCNWSYLDESCILLLEKLFETVSPDVPMHISDLLITVLQLSPPETLVVKRLCDSECVQKLLQHSVSDNADTSDAGCHLDGTASVCLASISVLESLISRLFESSLPFEQHMDREIDIDNEHLNDVKASIEAICSQFIYFIPKINTILKHYMDSKETVVKRLGHRGLQLVKLIESVVRISNNDVDLCMCENGLFGTCVELFYYFKTNSLLHLSLQRIFITIIESDSSRSATQVFLLDECRLMRAIISTVNGYDAGLQNEHETAEIASANENEIRGEKSEFTRKYFATRHSSIMGNAILIAQALSLCLEVDMQNINKELSDILEREFVNGGEDTNEMITTASKVDTTTGTPTEGFFNNTDSSERFVEHSTENLSLRCLIDRENLLTSWDVFVEEKLRPILEHQSGGNPYTGSNLMLMNPPFAMQQQDGGSGLKLGVDFDFGRMAGDDDDDDDDDDEDDDTNLFDQGNSVQRTSNDADVWGDYFKDDNIHFEAQFDVEASNADTGVEEGAPSTSAQQDGNSFGGADTAVFDFSGFADFDSFNDATQTFSEPSDVDIVTPVSDTNPPVVDFAQFANFDSFEAVSSEEDH